MADRTRAEMETVIQRSGDEQEWHVWSADPRVIRVLERRAGPGQKHGGGLRWTVGASCVRFAAPPKALSEAERKAAAARMKANLAKKEAP